MLGYIAYRMLPASNVPGLLAAKVKEVAVKIVEQPVKVKTNVTERIKNEANALLNGNLTSDIFDTSKIYFPKKS
ncbi:MAG: hypothetical protein LBS09_06045 [Bacteroidales bacterium]|jgi:hypothetical protein|nr:hypothetical protein [Bacteroidales bacterium]